MGYGRVQPISAGRLPAGSGGIEPWVKCARYASLTLLFVVVVAVGGKADAVGGSGLRLSGRRSFPPVLAAVIHAGYPTLNGLAESRAI